MQRYQSGLFSVGGRALNCDVLIAKSFLQRARGLLFYPAIQPHQALWIWSCGSVHTVGMSYPIDVVFINEQHRILKMVTSMAPYRFSACWGAKSVIEFRAGRAEQLGFQLEQTLTFQSKI
jgi:uncharacterized protein